MMRDASEHVEMGWGALWVGRMATLCMADGTHKSLLRHVSEPTNHFFVLITADAIANTYEKGVPICSQLLFEPISSPSAPDLRIAPPVVRASRS